jgi:DNA repair protein RecN (Recombination protein N)
MLTHLHIRDFAIIDELELDLYPGMTALTGETGAGKSIVLDAIELVLGDRASAETVRAGAMRAEISARFEVDALPEARQWLRENELQADEECILRRTVTAEGRSRGYINGQAAPNQSLRELGELLVDLHGQHEHQSLLRRDVQRQLLDGFGDLSPQARKVAQLHVEWRDVRERLAALEGAGRERAERVDLLRYQVGELDALGLQETELGTLDAEHARLAHADRLLEGGRQALMALYEGEQGSVHDLLSATAGELSALSRLDSALAPLLELLDSAQIQVQEAAEGLRAYLAGCEVDPARLEEIDRRLGLIHDLARKHRCEPEDLPALAESLRGELEALEHADQDLGVLRGRQQVLGEAYEEAARRLTRERTRAASQLSRAVTEQMQSLGMLGGRFEVTLSEREGTKRYSATGLDEIEFLVTANPGQPRRTLARVASGGELSRISLAIQVVTVQSGRIPTLIFDEVDTGIGGAVAEVVGRQLRRLGEERQVLCVTHLPQVAAQAHHHLRVIKQAEADEVHTRVARLQARERVEEVARMLGGIEITEQSLRHAEEMLARADAGSKAAAISP